AALPPSRTSLPQPPWIEDGRGVLFVTMSLRSPVSNEIEVTPAEPHVARCGPTEVHPGPGVRGAPRSSRLKSRPAPPSTSTLLASPGAAENESVEPVTETVEANAGPAVTATRPPASAAVARAIAVRR